LQVAGSIIPEPVVEPIISPEIFIHHEIPLSPRQIKLFFLARTFCYWLFCAERSSPMEE
jgi:hypothetical protein